MQIEMGDAFFTSAKPWPKNRARRGKSKVMEQIDLFLEGMGLYRKQTARDATCLFRAVSEQIFYSQCFHYSVRLSCIHFMERNKCLFPEKIDGEKFEDHSRRLRSPREWGGHWEMQAMALLYKRDFIVFTDINTAPIHITNNNFPDKILLCQIGPNHFDSVFTKAFIDTTAMCQALVYELLYGQVFGMEDIDAAIQVMLYEGKQSKDQSQVPASLIENGRPNSVINVLVKGGTPFPYKVAKALDPRMYRNVEFDLWNDERKEMKKNSIFHNEILQIGSKCMVKISGNPDHQYPAYIQDMQPDKGPVTVFVEVLGERCIVPYENIEPIILPVIKPRCLCINGQNSGAIQSAVKFRKFRSNRCHGDKSTREIVYDKSDPSSKINSKTQQLDLNNNNHLENQVVVWDHSNNTNTSVSLGTPDSSASLESQESYIDSEPSIVEQPYYVVAPPSQWGVYPPLPPCPPPSLPCAFGPPPVHLPTPIYVTFSDGTTMLMPTQRIPESPTTQVVYYDPTTMPSPFPAQYSIVGPSEPGNFEQLEENNTPIDQHNQDESQSIERNSCEGQALLQVSSVGYWGEQLIPAGFYPPQPVPCPSSQLINGEIAPLAVYLSPSYPTYHISA